MAPKASAEKTSLGKQLKKSLAAIEKTKTRIAKERDTLRDQLEEAQSIYEDMNTVVDELEDAFRTIENAADELSKYM
jgi:molecular chaperone GrpE (heat shock protein)